LTYDLTVDLDATDDSNLYFSPDRGNVVFASAMDTWGFRPTDFVHVWSKRLNLPVTQLKETLVIDGIKEEVTTMAEKLGVRLDERAIRNVDSRGALRALMMNWLPLGATVMSTIVDICPSPLNAVSADRAVHMLYGDTVNALSGPLNTGNTLGENRPIGAMNPCTQINQSSHMTLDSLYANSGASLAIQASNSAEDAPTIVFVAKVFWTDKSVLDAGRAPKSEPGPRPPGVPVIRPTRDPDDSELKATDPQEPALPNTDTQVSSTKSGAETDARMALLRSPLLSTNPFADVEFVALARIFSGRVYPGQRLFVLGPKFDGRKVRSSVVLVYEQNLDVTKFARTLVKIILVIKEFSGSLSWFFTSAYIYFQTQITVGIRNRRSHPNKLTKWVEHRSQFKTPVHLIVFCIHLE
uniref:Capsid protein n=1 Tax=Echinostoma caproni TaxID=27848 RepID=A0A183B2L8_9TREM